MPGFSGRMNVALFLLYDCEVVGAESLFSSRRTQQDHIVIRYKKACRDWKLNLIVIFAPSRSQGISSEYTDSLGGLYYRAVVRMAADSRLNSSRNTSMEPVI
jgi:hypothetical protein